MQTMDLRRGNFEANELIVRCDAGSYVVACGTEGENEVVFVPRDDDAARREQARLAEIAGPGIPRCDTHPAPEPGRVIVRLIGLGGAVPLHAGPPLTAAQLRSALTRLTSALSHAHSRGWFHGRIAAPLVLVDPRAECWLVGWADARPIRPGARNDAGLDEVSRDLRDVGMALLRHLLRAPPDAAGDLSDDEVEAAVIAIRADDPELARVLARLASADQRECYESATEVLTDLGERDESMPDVWAELPFVGRRSIVRLVMRRLELAGGPEGGLSSLELAGPSGSGRSRLLAECARAARERGVAVIMLDGRTGAQPWGPLGDLARQLLARTPADASAREGSALTTLLAACTMDSAEAAVRRPAAPLETAEGVAAALADLAQAALGGQRAVLLLDDEDCMHQSARTAWRLLGRHVAETTDTHQALRALLVSATTAATATRPTFPGAAAQPRAERKSTVTDDTGARRETLQIEDLTRPRIHRLLTSILAEPGMASALVHDVHDLTGGRIVEVVEHLRLLAARGVLRPVGRRWRLHDPGTPFRAIAIPEATRRTLADAGTEATRIAELLAITPDMRLDRATLIELAEIPPHRFQSAVDAAERAGLILRTGAAWRLRTQTLRARIDAALPAERRRSLHREILFRLLDAEPRDLPAIATHARGAGDPRAIEWTREAIAYLMSARRHPEVVAHYEESRDLIDPAGIDTSLKLDYCEALLEVGRIGPATDGAMQVLLGASKDSPTVSRAVSIACLSLRLANSWRAILRLQVPDHCNDAEARSSFRLLRSAAFAKFGRTESAGRELRLARAELDPQQSVPGVFTSLVALANAVNDMRLQRYVSSVKQWLTHAQEEGAAGRHFMQVAALGAVSDSIRYFGRTATSLRVLQRARNIATTLCHCSPVLLSRIAGASARLKDVGGDGRAATTRMELALFHATRSQSRDLCLYTRLALILRRVHAASAGISDRLFVSDLFSTQSEVTLQELADLGVELAVPLLYFGMHENLRRLANECRSDAHPPAATAAVLFGLGHSTLYTAGSTADLLDDTGARSPGAALIALHGAPGLRGLRALLEPQGLPDCDRPTKSCAVLAHWLRTQDPGLGEASHVEDVTSSLRTNAEFFWGRADLALTILLDAVPIAELGASLERGTLEAVLRTRLPLALEWKRVLARAVIAKRFGDLLGARTLADRAFAQLTAVLRPEMGSAGPRLFAYGTRLFAQVGLGRELSAPEVAADVRPRPSVRAATTHAAPRAWMDALDRFRENRRAVFTSPAPADLDAFCVALMEVSAGPAVIWDGSRAPRAAPVGAKLIVCQLIETWDDDQLRDLLRLVLARAAGGPDLVATSTKRAADLRQAGGLLRALVDHLDFIGTPVPAPLRISADRPSTISWCWTRLEGGRTPLDADTVDALARRAWLGGVAELRAALRVVRTAGTAAALKWTPEQPHLSLGPRPEGWSGVDPRIAGTALDMAAAAGSVSARELSATTGTPLRTAQRRLDELVRHDALLRVGRGRATRYVPAR